jgi:hypothetical protein
VIQLKYKTPDTDWHLYQADIDRMRTILNDRGYDASDSDIAKAWEDYSDMYAAGWLVLCEEDFEIFDALLNHLEQ